MEPLPDLTGCICLQTRIRQAIRCLQFTECKITPIELGIPGECTKTNALFPIETQYLLPPPSPPAQLGLNKNESMDSTIQSFFCFVLFSFPFLSFPFLSFPFLSSCALNDETNLACFSVNPKQSNWGELEFPLWLSD